MKIKRFLLNALFGFLVGFMCFTGLEKAGINAGNIGTKYLVIPFVVMCIWFGYKLKEIFGKG